MMYHIFIEDSFEITSGKYVLVTDSCPILQIQEELTFPISVKFRIGTTEYDGQIVLPHYQFSEMTEGFWSFQRELILLAAPNLSFKGQIINAIIIKN